jgi:hypothetical protein
VAARSFSASKAVASESICAGERVLRHLQALSKRTRLLDLGRDVIGKRVLHARQENELSDGLLPMRLSSGAKFSGFLMPAIS